MTKRVCICVGVINHEDSRLTQLKGTEVDAKSMFAALTDPEKGEYEKNLSALLLDPKKQELSTAVADLAYDEDVDTFTFFFAGHGAVKNDSFALCCTDTNCDRFIATAFPISELFQVLNDAQPRHSNVIIDSCEAAGMIADIGSLLKRSLSRARSASISIFASSAANRSARETSDGGIGTCYVLDCIEGRKDCRVAKEYLSLDDIGEAVDNEFGDQSPSVSSFNISGPSQFVRNPKVLSDQCDFVRLPEFAPYVLPKIKLESSEELWRLYIDAGEEIEVRTLQDRIESAIHGLEDSREQAGFIIGLSESFASRGSMSKDCFASVEILNAFLFATQVIEDETVRNEIVSYLLTQIYERLSRVLIEVSDALSLDYGMLAKSEGIAEFYALPVRISKVAAWSLASTFLAQQRGNREFVIQRDVVSSILCRLKENYSQSFSLMSEEQAPYIFLISELAERFEFTSWSEEYISTLYADYFLVDRKIAKVWMPAEEIFSFFHWRCGGNSVSDEQFIAKPSELLLVLLYHFFARRQLEIIRYDFEELDDTMASTFVPDRYSSFSDELISDGKNIHFQIGFDVFTAREFSEFVEEHLMTAVEAAVGNVGKSALTVALLASLIYPDRILWFLVLSGEERDESFCVK